MIYKNGWGIKMLDEIANSIMNEQWKQAAEQLVQYAENEDQAYADILETLVDEYGVSVKDMFKLLRMAEQQIVK